jgi:hypothetical protein
MLLHTATSPQIAMEAQSGKRLDENAAIARVANHRPATANATSQIPDIIEANGNAAFPAREMSATYIVKIFPAARVDHRITETNHSHKIRMLVTQISQTKNSHANNEIYLIIHGFMWRNRFVCLDRFFAIG